MKKENIFDLKGRRYSTSILEEARKIAIRAENPRKIKSRVVKISLVLLVSLAVTVTILIIISTGMPVSDQARALTILLLLLSVAIVVAAGLAIVFVLLGALVYDHVLRIDTQAELADATAENVALVEALASIGNDPGFRSELVTLVIDSVPARWESDPAQISDIAAQVSAEPVFGRRLYGLISRYLSRDTALIYLLEEARVDPRLKTN